MNGINSCAVVIDFVSCVGRFKVGKRNGAITIQNQDMDPASNSGIVINRRLVFLNSASSVFTRFLNLTVLLWMYKYLLSNVSASHFSIYPVLMAMMAFVPLFFSFLTSGISRFAVAAYAVHDQQEVTSIVTSVFFSLLVLTALFLTLGGILAWNLETVFVVDSDILGQAQLMTAILFLGAGLQAIVTPFQMGIHITQKFMLMNLIEILRDVVRAILLFSLLLGIGPEVIWVVVATVSTNVAAAFCIAVISMKLVPCVRLDPHSFAVGKAKELMGFGSWATLGQISSMIHTSAGTLVLNRFGSAVDVTNYHMGSIVDRQVQSLTTFASAPVQPVLTAMHSTGDVTRLGNAYLTGGRYALWANLLPAVPLMVLGPELVTAYLGPEFTETAYVLGILLAVYPITYSCIMLPKIAIAMNRIRLFFLAAILFQMLNVIVMILLTGVHDMGAIGIAIAISSTLAIGQLTVFWPMGLRLSNVSFHRFFNEVLFPGLMPAIVAFTLLLIVKSVASSFTNFWLFAYVSAGGVVYLLILYLVLSRRERRVIHSLAFRHIRRSSLRCE